MVDCTSMTSESLPKVTLSPRNFALVAALYAATKGLSGSGRQN